MITLALISFPFLFLFRMTESEKAKNIFTFKDEKPVPFDCKYTTTVRDQHVPLIIDNGINLYF